MECVVVQGPDESWCSNRGTAEFALSHLFFSYLLLEYIKGLWPH